MSKLKKVLSAFEPENRYFCIVLSLSLALIVLKWKTLFFGRCTLFFSVVVHEMLLRLLSVYAFVAAMAGPMVYFGPKSFPRHQTKKTLFWFMMAASSFSMGEAQPNRIWEVLV